MLILNSQHYLYWDHIILFCLPKLWLLGNVTNVPMRHVMYVMNNHSVLHFALKKHLFNLLVIRVKL